MAIVRKITIGVLRREVSAQERAEIQRTFSGKTLRFIRLNSRDYLEHAAKCRLLKLDLVLLPLDRPIPSTAMEDGVPHVTFIPGKGLQELLPLKPQFRDFVPRA